MFTLYRNVIKQGKIKTANNHVDFMIRFCDSYNAVLVAVVNHVVCVSCNTVCHVCRADVQTALKNDPAASEFLSYVTQCYSSQTQNYYK